MAGIDRAGADVLLIWATLHFELPGPRDRSPPKPAADQPPPSAAPLWVGEPGVSSLLWEAPIAYARATTEIHVRADACAPAGTRVTELTVGARVGPCQQHAVVFGERRWVGRSEVTVPKPFERIPLIWEHAFGGSSTLDERTIETRNPIGTGMYAGMREAVGQRLPNIEDPRQRIGDVGDRPEPVGFLPRGTSWEPRARLAGTYDQTWVESRCPLWPEDFDERHFLGAPPALIAPHRLEGGEPVVLVGMDPRGDIGFALPRARVWARTRFRGRSQRDDLALDIVQIDAIERRLRLVYRAGIPAHRELEDHLGTTVEWSAT
nr:DUF2169 domain-containing protein [Pseudenhygromyxa sp. WMMC2535]